MNELKVVNTGNGGCGGQRKRSRARNSLFTESDSRTFVTLVVMPACRQHYRSRKPVLKNPTGSRRWAGWRVASKRSARNVKYARVFYDLLQWTKRNTTMGADAAGVFNGASQQRVESRAHPLWCNASGTSHHGVKDLRENKYSKSLAARWLTMELVLWCATTGTRQR